jgi:hypothetical protein
MKRLETVAFAALILTGVVDVSLAQSDDIRIVALAPVEGVTRGVETAFTVEVDVDLQSADEATARIGFNVASPQQFRIFDSRDLQRGRNRLTFTVKVVPVDWGDRDDFAVMVDIGPRTDTKRFQPTASVTKVIPVSR